MTLINQTLLPPVLIKCFPVKLFESKEGRANFSKIQFPRNKELRKVSLKQK